MIELDETTIFDLGLSPGAGVIEVGLPTSLPAFFARGIVVIPLSSEEIESDVYDVLGSHVVPSG